MSARRSVTSPKNVIAKSRVTNGKEILPGVDGRSLIARRYRDIVAALVSDAGNPAHMSEARMQLCWRFAALSVQAEALEAQMVGGLPVDLSVHTQISSTLVRIASRLGIERRARNVVPSIADYIEGRKTS